MFHNPRQPNSRQRCKNWLLLVVCTLCCMGVLTMLHIPAASLIGAIVVSVVFALRNVNLHEPQLLFHMGQNIVGCMMAASVSPSVLASMLDNWFLMAFCVVFAILVGFCIGIYMTLHEMLPGTTAIWGASPGAAAAMTVMSAEYGADMRLVALMQYLRVMLIALFAAAAAKGLGLDPHTHGVDIGFIQATLTQLSDWRALLPTLALLLVSGYASWRVPFAGGALLLPLFSGVILQCSGLMPRIILPAPLLLTAYALIGWGIGLRFDRQVFSYALHVMPRILFAILLMIGTSACLIVPLVKIAGTDLLTACLATSPGGLDSVSIIAAASGADLAIVMTIQTGRMILVTLISPPLARFAARYVELRKNRQQIKA